MTQTLDSSRGLLLAVGVTLLAVGVSGCSPVGTPTESDAAAIAVSLVSVVDDGRAREGLRVVLASETAVDGLAGSLSPEERKATLLEGEDCERWGDAAMLAAYDDNNIPALYQTNALSVQSASTFRDEFAHVTQPHEPIAPLYINGRLISPVVGKLFSVRADGLPTHCTASVVDTPAGNTIYTAAHCVHPTSYSESDLNNVQSDFCFVPGWYAVKVDGVAHTFAPYARYDGVTATYPTAWHEGVFMDAYSKYRYDQAFIKVRGEFDSTSVQYRVGANGMAVDVPSPVLGVSIWGYPLNKMTLPFVDSVNATPSSYVRGGFKAYPTRMAAGDSSPFGASGGPWFERDGTTTGTPDRGVVRGTTSFSLFNPDVVSSDRSFHASGVTLETKALYQKHVSEVDK